MKVLFVFCSFVLKFPGAVEISKATNHKPHIEYVLYHNSASSHEQFKKTTSDGGTRDVE